MSADDDAVAAPAARGVEFRGLARDELRDRRGEAFEVARLGEADVGLHRERQQPHALLLRLRPHPRHVAHHIGGRVDQMFGGELVLHRARHGERRGCTTAGLRRHHRRIDDEGLGAGDEDALDTAAALALFDEIDELRLFQRAQVVVDALPAHRQLGRELRRRCGLAQPFEQTPPDRREADAKTIRLVQQGDGGGHEQ